jgi:hypothetical protein
LEGILPNSPGFQVGLFRRIEETLLSLERKSLMLEVVSRTFGKEILAICQHFQLGESFSIRIITSSDEIGKHVCFAAIQTVLEAGMSCALFPMTMDLVFERNSAYLSVISGGETFTSFKIVLFTRIEETSVFCGRKLSM